MAKFGIALGSGPRGLGFESRYSDHRKKPCDATRFKAFSFFYIHLKSIVKSLGRTKNRTEVKKWAAINGNSGCKGVSKWHLSEKRKLVRKL